MQISRITQNVSFFVVTKLTANFNGFLLLPSKVHADVKNDWLYCKVEMSMKSEMYVKYGHAFLKKNK